MEVVTWLDRFWRLCGPRSTGGGWSSQGGDGFSGGRGGLVASRPGGGGHYRGPTDVVISGGASTRGRGGIRPGGPGGGGVPGQPGTGGPKGPPPDEEDEPWKETVRTPRPGSYMVPDDDFVSHRVPDRRGSEARRVPDRDRPERGIINGGTIIGRGEVWGARAGRAVMGPDGFVRAVAVGGMDRFQRGGAVIIRWNHQPVPGVVVYGRPVAVPVSRSPGVIPA